MRSILLALALVPPLLLSAPAQTMSGTPPTDVRLTVRVQTGQSTFRIGEVIPLELSFSSTSPNKYQFDNASYDRSGRLNAETFAIEPGAGWDDPLALYFRSFQCFIGGGLRGISPLSTQPTIIHLELNEWVRFKEPGRYRVTVTSSRVSKTGSSSILSSVQVTSNELTLTLISPTKQWQESILQAATAALDGPPQTTSARPDQTRPDQSDARKQAVKTLRYLGTADAAREMARRIGGEWDWEFKLGLAGSPSKEAGLEEMNKLLVDPKFPVTEQFLTAMSVIAVPDGAGDDRPAQRDKAEEQFRRDLALAVADKEGKARAVSANTIVEDAVIRLHALPPDLKRRLTRDLIADFDQLPLEKQSELIQYRWAALDHQQMLPLLRTLAQRYRDFPELREMHASQFNNLTASALQHWYEMAPDEARPVVIQEILRPKPRFSTGVLGILPDEELPEVEQSLAEHLNPQQNYETIANVALLIERYATPAIEARVTNFLDPVLGKEACDVQEALLAYLLKVDPEGARPRIESAIGARGEGFSACNRMLLPEVARLQNHPVLEDIAIKSLDDLDPQVVAGAAAYLKDYGSAAAEDVLWSHFTAWSERWKGRESDFQQAPGPSSDIAFEGSAGSNLAQALAAGQGWLADEVKLHRLINLSVGPQQREEAEEYLRVWRKRPWSIQFILAGSTQFQIAQYRALSMQAAKDKLAQFPRGSIFAWSGVGEGDEAKKASQELSGFANEHGLRLVASNE